MNKILLVDDDRHTGEALAATLRILGYAVEVVVDGKRAEERAAEFLPDIAVVDLNLPGISGMDVVSRLSSSPQPVYCCLATGMAEFSLLKRALAAGAWTLMGKPFGLVHLNAILQTAAVMITARNLSKTMRETLPQDMLMITRRGDTPVNSEDMARVMRYAERCGADDETYARRLPIIAYELLSNARTFGAKESSEHTYRLLMQEDEASIQVLVADSGRGFAWKRELPRLRNRWDKSKASGLQLVTALCDSIEYSEDEFTASVSVSKIWTPEPAERPLPFVSLR